MEILKDVAVIVIVSMMIVILGAVTVGVVSIAIEQVRSLMKEIRKDQEDNE